MTICVCVSVCVALCVMYIFLRVLQLYRASVLFETIRHETQHSTDYKLSMFDLQTSSYQALQRVLVNLGKLADLSSCVVIVPCESHLTFTLTVDSLSPDDWVNFLF